MDTRSSTADRDINNLTNSFNEEVLETAEVIRGSNISHGFLMVSLTSATREEPWRLKLQPWKCHQILWNQHPSTQADEGRQGMLDQPAMWKHWERNGEKKKKKETADKCMMHWRSLQNHGRADPVIDDSSGEFLTKNTAVLNRWTQYCQNLYNHLIQPDINLIDWDSTSMRTPSPLPVLREEVEEAMWSLPTGSRQYSSRIA